MKWIVAKHLIGEHFEIIETEVVEFDESKKAYAQKRAWEKEASSENPVEVYISLV